MEDAMSEDTAPSSEAKPAQVIEFPLPRNNAASTVCFVLPFLGYSDPITSDTSPEHKKICACIGGNDIVFNLGTMCATHFSLEIFYSQRHGLEHKSIRLSGPIGEIIRLPSGNCLVVSRSNSPEGWAITLGSAE